LSDEILDSEFEEAIPATEHEYVGGQEEVPPAEAEVELTLEEKLAAAEAQAAEYLDGWQRSRAEYANARKRLERQRAEAFSHAAVAHATTLLPILDDFDRALDNVPQNIAGDGWFEGIVLVRRKLQKLLDDLKVEPIEALGQPFDPNFHEALGLKDVDGAESGTVIEELQTGYRIGDRVIRPALVNVAA
jgi:molecular chaperone GrpE